MRYSEEQAQAALTALKSHYAGRYADLAQDLGVDRRQISRWSHGFPARGPVRAVVVLLARSLGLVG